VSAEVQVDATPNEAMTTEKTQTVLLSNVDLRGAVDIRIGPAV
jgi:hypothetical protein